MLCQRRHFEVVVFDNLVYIEKGIFDIVDCFVTHPVKEHVVLKLMNFIFLVFLVVYGLKVMNKNKKK